MLLVLLASQLFLTPTAQAAEPAWALVPGGVGVYAHGHPWRGTAYALTQAAGAGFLVWGSVSGSAAAEAGDDAAYARASTWTALGVTLTAASYLAGAVDASRLHDMEGGGGRSPVPPRPEAPPPVDTSPVEAAASPLPAPAAVPDSAPLSPAPATAPISTPTEPATPTEPTTPTTEPRP
jgi:hypothetical protein